MKLFQLLGKNEKSECLSLRWYKHYGMIELLQTVVGHGIHYIYWEKYTGIMFAQE